MQEQRRTVTQRLHAGEWTYADYLRLPDDGTRCEILEGERVMTPAPFTPHQRVSRNLEVMLHLFLSARGLGEVLDAPCDVILADNVVVQPDLFVVLKGRASIITEDAVFGSPDLVIEILSKSGAHRDVVWKKDIYGRFGVPEYWIVDPTKRHIDVLVHDGRRLVLRASHDDGDVRSLVTLPGFAAPLSAIFTSKS